MTVGGAGDRLIRRLLPAHVHASELTVDITDEPLFPEELAYIAPAVPARRNEFATVRHCARLALRQLGVERPPLVPGDGGAPPWPPGVVGSMTHCAGYRAAVVARTSMVLSVGIDAEPDEPLPAGVLETVTSAGERARLADLAAVSPELHWDRLTFSAKESVYKTWYPLTHRWLDFEDVEVRLGTDGTFSADLLTDGLRESGHSGNTMHGRWLSAGGLVLTAIVIRA